MGTANAERLTHVEHWMEHEPLKVCENDSMFDAIVLLKEKHLTALPVVDIHGCLIGILSISDLLERVQATGQVLRKDFPLYEDCYWVSEMVQHMFGTDKVVTAMTPVPVTAAPDDTLQQVAKLMLDSRVHHIPVVDQQKKLLGIISALDLVRLAIDGG